MRRTVKVFILPAHRGPAGPPEPGPEFTVEARTEDGLLAAASAELASRGQRLRSLSFSLTGLVAYVEGPP